jgi:hypothetical protein
MSAEEKQMLKATAPRGMASKLRKLGHADEIRRDLAG